MKRLNDHIRRFLLLSIGIPLLSLSGCAQEPEEEAVVPKEQTEEPGQEEEEEPQEQEPQPEPEPEQALAFPGAEGFGKYTTGGRGGKVLVVTNLNDSGPGSLREAIKAEGPRIIVFAVSGTIDLQSALEVKNGDLTIAGQSAPGGGITLRNYPLKVKDDNVIIRYIRSRMGDAKMVQDDAISIIGQEDIIVDHSSFSWGTDESASFYDNKDFTLQWSIISESLNNSVHEKGEHGYGGIWGGKGATFHHNLLAHHKSRNPRFNGARTMGEPAEEVADFRNNVIYNWKENSAYAGEEGNYNIVSNYYKAGPATEEDVQDRIVEVWDPYGNFYVADNFVHNFPAVTLKNSLGVDGDEPEEALVTKPVEVVAIPEQSAEEAFEAVLAHAGASYQRDKIDQRIVEETRTGTASMGEEKDGIIDTQQQVGGWPELEQGTAPPDQDLDGMPDAWEQEHGLDSGNAEDAAAYSLDKLYTNIEVYLNGLVAPK